MPTIQVGPTEYYFREQGHGPLVILAHSDASSSAQWRGLMESLGGEFRLRAFDTSGQGKSAAWPAGLPYTIEKESAVVEALIGAATEPVQLVGHSYGATFVLDAALRLRDRVASLTLIEPILFFLLRATEFQEAWRDAAAWGERLGPMIDAGNEVAALEMFIDYWNGPGSWKRMPDEMQQFIVKSAPKLRLQWDAVAWKDTTPAAYSELGMPTLLIRGAETTLSARVMVNIMHETLPNVRLVEIPGAGHLSPITHADEVNAHIVAHLRNH